eukprot:gnl/Spiro4/9160_TR4824_c0_g1_i1.p1 gnl/Spiro4/9160_TR4824_c0_g1~~gnl/Spiro4/9160_TR4824_c0_g1_i1.p1  ORF type:complete len:239 (+),score=43.37 gnl/Spiro4/9160_TR4824_c0_g1_i1:61-717(+)
MSMFAVLVQLILVTCGSILIIAAMSTTLWRKDTEQLELGGISVGSVTIQTSLTKFDMTVTLLGVSTSFSSSFKNCTDATQDFAFFKDVTRTCGDAYSAGVGVIVVSVVALLAALIPIIFMVLYFTSSRDLGHMSVTIPLGLSILCVVIGITIFFAKFPTFVYQSTQNVTNQTNSTGSSLYIYLAGGILYILTSIAFLYTGHHNPHHHHHHDGHYHTMR